MAFTEAQQIGTETERLGVAAWVCFALTPVRFTEWRCSGARLRPVRLRLHRQTHRPSTSSPSSAAVVIAYAALTAVMTWPFVDYRHFADSGYGGDARLIIWTTAWANHAVLNGLPLFDANIFFPAHQSLRYNEHLLGVSLATLPFAAAGASPCWPTTPPGGWPSS